MTTITGMMDGGVDDATLARWFPQLAATLAVEQAARSRGSGRVSRVSAAGRMLPAGTRSAAGRMRAAAEVAQAEKVALPWTFDNIGAGGVVLSRTRRYLVGGIARRSAPQIRQMLESGAVVAVAVGAYGFRLAAPRHEWRWPAA